jgi:predicted amidohydrolase
VKVAAIQHDICWEDPAATIERVSPLVDTALAEGAGLIFLTEMYSTGFSMASDRIAEDLDGPSAGWLRRRAEQAHVWLGASVPLRTPGLPTNTMILAGPDGEVRMYAKRHPFSYGGEEKHYAAGDRTITLPIGDLRVTPAICYDLRFADQFWNVAPTTDLYAVVANWPALRRHHWRSLLVARAIENQSYVLGVNRVGRGGGLDYVGDSCIVDPMGEVVASAAADETVIVADVDPGRVRSVRSRFPFLADR